MLRMIILNFYFVNSFGEYFVILCFFVKFPAKKLAVVTYDTFNLFVFVL